MFGVTVFFGQAVLYIYDVVLCGSFALKVSIYNIKVVLLFTEQINFAKKTIGTN